ncbi:MAG TPA: hypothetical protein VFC39_10595 [Acidobacteriaceae bacterium]|nr:hypothetical protein [Acidobacteriaceae bacterium]
MSRDSWKSVSNPKDCSWSKWFSDAANEIWGTLCGVPGFFTKRLPEILREEFAELNKMAISACRLGYHFCKFLGVTLAWLAALLLPLILCPGWITLGWAVLFICASVWGYRQFMKKRQASESRKEGWNASA